MGNLLVLPMAFYVFYIFFLGVLTFRVRKAAVQSGEVHPRYFKAYCGTESVPEHVVVVGRHFDNQFQLPPLFFVACVTAIALAKINELTLILAWSFVASRIVHSYIHLGRNRIMGRAIAYGVGLVLLMGLWLQLIF